MFVKSFIHELKRYFFPIFFNLQTKLLARQLLREKFKTPLKKFWRFFFRNVNFLTTFHIQKRFQSFMLLDILKNDLQRRVQQNLTTLSKKIQCLYFTNVLLTFKKLITNQIKPKS